VPAIADNESGASEVCEHSSQIWAEQSGARCTVLSAPRGAGWGIKGININGAGTQQYHGEADKPTLSAAAQSCWHGLKCFTRGVFQHEFYLSILENFVYPALFES
jgi:hypothetical protein